MSASPIAFLSYVRDDDKDANCYISSLREELAKATRLRMGSNFKIFQDWQDIGWGEDWQYRIEQSLDSAMCFIPVVTTRFFESSFCRDELKRFLEREVKLGRKDLVLPIYFVTCTKFEDASERSRDPLAEAVYKHHYIDWRELWLFELTSPEVRKVLAEMAEQISNTLNRKPASLPATPVSFEERLKTACSIDELVQLRKDIEAQLEAL